MDDLKNIRSIAQLKSDLMGLYQTHAPFHFLNDIDEIIHVILSSEVCKDDIKDWYKSLKDRPRE